MTDSLLSPNSFPTNKSCGELLTLFHKQSWFWVATARPFSQIAWHLNTRGYLWTKCAPIASGIACSIQKTFRDFGERGRKVSLVRSRSKMSSALLARTVNIGGSSSATTHYWTNGGTSSVGTLRAQTFRIVSKLKPYMLPKSERGR